MDGERLECEISFGLVVIVDPRQLVNPCFKVANYTLPQETVTAAAKFFVFVFFFQCSEMECLWV